MPRELKIGVIGGGPLPVQWNTAYETVRVDTPFGPPSDEIAVTRLESGNVVYSMLRHGRRHASGADVNHRANVAAMSQVGCDVVVSVSLCGALSARFKVGDTVIYDDVIDFRKTVTSFYSPQEAKHFAMAPMVDCDLEKQLSDIAADGNLHFRANMVVIEGPRYSTFAESRMFATLGGELICQTVSPECFLIREKGMAWFGCALVTDLDTRDRSHLVSTKLIFDNMKHFESRFADDLRNLLTRIRPWLRLNDKGTEDVPRSKLSTYKD